jgi:hypothetical protein
MYGNPALYHIRYESDRGRAIIDPGEDGLLPALGVHSRIPIAFDGCALREDTYDAKHAKKNLHDTADSHHPAEDRVRPDIMEKPCLVVDHLAGHGQRIAAHVESYECQQTYVYLLRRSLTVPGSLPESCVDEILHSVRLCQNFNLVCVGSIVYGNDDENPRNPPWYLVSKSARHWCW